MSGLFRVRILPEGFSAQWIGLSHSYISMYAANRLLCALIELTKALFRLINILQDVRSFKCPDS